MTGAGDGERGEAEPGPRPAGPRGAARLWWLPVLLAAVLPSFGTLDAPWISDDAAVLGYVHREGAFADWAGSQHDLRTLRFWRPLVTTTVGLQEATTGIAPAPLRLLNLAGHALAALALGAIALRLGAGAAGALVAGGFLALCPHQGGTVTWILGRVDSQCVPLLLGACLAALSGRTRLALLAGLGALATKELAFVLPAAAWLLVWAAEGRARVATRRTAPLFVLLALVLVWRRIALGVWVGGYPAAGAPGPGVVVEALRALSGELGPLAGVVLGFSFVAGVLRPAARRTFVAGLGLALLACVPLVHLLAAGPIPPEHLRTLFLADAGLGLALVAGLVGAGPAGAGAAEGSVLRGDPRLRTGLVALGLAVLVLRAPEARADVLRWTEAARLGEAHVARTRRTLEGLAPSADPVLDPTLPRVHRGAYVLHWGVADRFRAPFPASPRPVWPYRPLFAGVDELAERPQRVTTPHDDLVWRFGGGVREVPEIPVVLRDPAAGVPGAELAVLRADERLFLGPERPTDATPVLEVRGTYAGARLELVLYTELGYWPALWLDEEALAAARGEPFLRLSLREAVSLVGPRSLVLFQVLAQAADLGARRAYLEVRAVDDAKGIRNRPIAASRLIPIEWGPELRDLLLPR